MKTAGPHTPLNGQTRGWPTLAGNYVLLECKDAVIALCHLQQHSILVKPGQSVQRGEALGSCGNSGNSTEPHLHLQAFDHPDIAQASPIRVTFGGVLPRGTIVNATPNTTS